MIFHRSYSEKGRLTLGRLNYRLRMLYADWTHGVKFLSLLVRAMGFKFAKIRHRVQIYEDRR